MGLFEKHRQRREQLRSEARAAAEAHMQQRIAEAYELRRQHNAPILADLEQYSGRLILVTNPGSVQGEYEAAIAAAIHSSMPAGSDYRISLHAKTSTHSGVGIGEAAGLIAYHLRDRAKGEVTYTGALQSLGRTGLSPHALQQVLEVSTFGPFMQEHPNLAHIAVSSALGIEGVNLNYPNAHYGDTFVYRGATEQGDMHWDKIFQSPISGDGPHHLS